MRALVLVVLVCSTPLIVKGYSRGASTHSCRSFKPKHNRTTAQTTNPPYSLTADVSSVISGEKIIVTLQANDGNSTFKGSSFKGFLIQARCTRCNTSETTIVSGTFAKMTVMDPIKTMTCKCATDNAISHADGSVKEKVSFTWTAPFSRDLKGIKFRGAVVKDFQTWWINLESPEIIYKYVPSAAGHEQFSVFILVVSVGIVSLINNNDFIFYT